MRFLSVCSGIEAASVAWNPLGWTCAGVSEIDAFPRSVLEQRHGAVAVDWDHRHSAGSNITPLFGDFTKIEAHHVGPIDLLVGGTPCQSFSIAGLRGGLDDDRGNLALEYLRLADRTRPRWLVWENVPGVLSSNGGRDFGAILGGMAELGYGFAYRVLDAQFFGLAQRRRRVFVVGHLGDWRRAAAVLFERHSLSGHPAPSRKARQVAPTIPSRRTGGGGLGTDFDCDGGLINCPAEVAPTLNAAFGSKLGLEDQHIRGGESGSLPDLGKCLTTGVGQRYDPETETLIPTIGGVFDVALETTHTLRAEGFDASEDGTGRGTPLVPVAFAQNTRDEVRLVGGDGSIVGALAAEAGMKQTSYVAFPAEMSATQCAATENLSPDLSVKHTTAVSIHGDNHADASQAHSDKILRELRESVGEEAYSEWCSGILAAFRTPEILRSKVHGASVRCKRDDWHKLGDNSLSRQKDGPSWAVLALWEAASNGCPPRGWEPSEQLARKLVAHLSELPHQSASTSQFLLSLWRSCEGLWLLRDALSTLQETWRPNDCENQSARMRSEVRRLTPREAERLQGFPDDYTLVTHRKKPAADGPRYKALGNSMAVPCMAWIGDRIAKVDALP